LPGPETQSMVWAIAPLEESISRQLRDRPEGDAVGAEDFSRLASRASATRVLCRLLARGRLLRICRGLYVRQIQTRWGARPPAEDALVEHLSRRARETIVPGGATAASGLGLTTQVPARCVLPDLGEDSIPRPRLARARAAPRASLDAAPTRQPRRAGPPSARMARPLGGSPRCSGPCGERSRRPSAHSYARARVCCRAGSRGRCEPSAGWSDLPRALLDDLRVSARHSRGVSLFYGSTGKRKAPWPREGTFR
jgi:hypothetical protein